MPAMVLSGQCYQPLLYNSTEYGAVWYCEYAYFLCAILHIIPTLAVLGFFITLGATNGRPKKERNFTMKKAITILAFLLLALVFTACNGDDATSPRTITDRDGFTVSLPAEINSIVTIGASNAEILIGLGFGGNIIAVDMFSADVVGLPAAVSTNLDMMALDAEYVVSLMPDVIFISGMARAGGEDDPLAPVSVAGIAVVYLPTSTSIADIMDDIRFIAYVMDAETAGETVVAAMQAEIDAIAAIAAIIATPRTVYVEISPAPWMFSTGSGTFLHELIELTGAVNIFGHMHDWIPVSDEILLELNPDVILTTTDFLPDPIGEIIERPGFNVISAVQSGYVFQIDANATQRPSQNIIYALREIAAAVFPEYFR